MLTGNRRNLGPGSDWILMRLPNMSNLRPVDLTGEHWLDLARVFREWPDKQSSLYNMALNFNDTHSLEE
jgi:hypothetical protein